MKEEKEQTVIDKTLLYLENYREMERYIKEAVSPGRRQGRPEFQCPHHRCYQ